ncbi:MAG: DUF542 domain-containing protein [Acidobacteriota bacterium]
MTDRGNALAECTVIGLAARDIRTAALFTELGFNFCHDGVRTVADACAAHGVALDQVLTRLEELELAADDDTRPDGAWWQLDQFSDYIVRRYHGYLKTAVPAIRTWLATLVELRKAEDPFLPEIRETFEDMAATIEAHLAKEEAILFPALAMLAEARRAGEGRPPLPFPTVLHPIRVMESEHERIAHGMTRLRELTHGFTPPPRACQTWRLCYAELARFERELCAHTHLENDLLFPRALELERQLV